MPSRRRRGNARARLQKQVKVQNDLEQELQQLNSGTNEQASAKEIIKFVESSDDPMLSPDNPFRLAGPPPCAGCILM